MALAQWTDAQILSQLNSGNKWSGSTITYAYAARSSGLYSVDGEAIGFVPLSTAAQAKAELAIVLWDDLIAPDIVRTSSESSYFAANIEFGMSTTQDSYAQAYYPSRGSVWFNANFKSGSDNLVNPTIGRHGFATYIHEIGHALGLDHMGNYGGNGARTPSSYQDSTVYSIMSYFGPDWGSGTKNGEGLVAWADWIGVDGIRYTPQTPMISDIYAIQSIYGAETTTRTGDTVYGFNSNISGTTRAIYAFNQNLNPILAIFDSDGIDTLDFSGWNSASIINLAPGSFSSCNAMTNNIAIAYNCSIENAVGGGGSDTISGNALANRLTGGAGDDTIYALSGDDIIVGGLGNDTIDGGDGIDYAYLEEDWSSISYSLNVATGSVAFTSQSHGLDKYVAVEFFVDAQNVTRSLAEIKATASVTPQKTVQTITLPVPDDWRLLAGDGFVGAVGGSGTVFGTAGYQQIEVLDRPGTVAFDPSFNSGGDAIVLAGAASSWTIGQFGSAALLTDGDSFVTIPVGTTGTAIGFDDGIRSLVFDAAANVVRLGDQALSNVLAPIATQASGAIPVGNETAGAVSRLFLAPGADVAVGGNFTIFGTNGTETIVVTRGKVGLDPSFNRGGDTLVLDEALGSFTAARSGSSVHLLGTDTDMTIPIGAGSINLHFADAERVIRYDAGLDQILVGSQVIGLMTAALTAFG